MTVVRIPVRLTPRGGRDALDGWSRDERGRPVLKVRVAAPPVEGAANAALAKVIAKALKVGARSVRIVSGEQSRLKQVEIDGVDQAEIDRTFGLPD